MTAISVPCEEGIRLPSSSSSSWTRLSTVDLGRGLIYITDIGIAVRHAAANLSFCLLCCFFLGLTNDTRFCDRVRDHGPALCLLEADGRPVTSPLSFARFTRLLWPFRLSFAPPFAFVRTPLPPRVLDISLYLMSFFCCPLLILPTFEESHFFFCP